MTTPDILTAIAIDQDAARDDLLSYLMRAGTYGHYWTPDGEPYTKDGRTVVPRYTQWFEVAKPKAPINGWLDKNLYWGVHPCTQRGLDPEVKPNKQRSSVAIIEAVNCLFSEFDGKDYVLEPAIQADLAIVKAWKGDRAGNLVFRKTARNFNPMIATCGSVTVAEVEELVEEERVGAVPGGVDEDDVGVGALTHQGADHRHDRGDARPRGDHQQRAGPGREDEVALRRREEEDVADPGAVDQVVGDLADGRHGDGGVLAGAGAQPLFL